ncbi:MAG TPA: glycerol-3-phosphate acyltransferase, partial [Opitutaceae bacterium]|nr:glycerol-3-phosphate acyltransferase [Opitutaceae bacterium]
ARANGVNIFEVGSKNPGATNVRRSVGKRAGALVLVLDILKGALGTALPLIAAWLLRPAGDPAADWEFAAGGVRLFGSADMTNMMVAGLVGAVLGHSYSLFTGFRGGKGVATGVGGLVVLIPIAALVAAIVWVATFYTTRYVSLASILGAVSVPFSAWFGGYPPLIIVIGALVGGFVIFRHRENISRLIGGTESKFTRKPPADGPPAG